MQLRTHGCRCGSGSTSLAGVPFTRPDECIAATGGPPRTQNPVRCAALLLSVLVACSVLIGVAPASGATTRHAVDGLVAERRGAPMIRTPLGKVPLAQNGLFSAVSSINWGGYVATGAEGEFGSAETSFVVPPVTCSAAENSAASFWVGIDGWGTKTVEQDGVLDICANGMAMYLAWYETYPQPALLFDAVAIRPGDSVVSSVSYRGNLSYRLQVADSTTGEQDSVVASAPGATNSSAECIAEDPSAAGGGQLPYANYGAIAFTSCTANAIPIGLLAPSPVTTATAQGATVASVSGLNNGTSFSMTREFPAPPPTPPTPPTPPVPPPLPQPIIGMASTPSGDGYWIANAYGDVSVHGAAPDLGSMAGTPLNSPITHVVATADGKGYWLVAGDGGIFSFGDAAFYGSMGGTHLNAPVVDLASTPDGRGYWLVALDGGVFSFGDARYQGSMGGHPLKGLVVGITADAQSGGYREVAADGGVFAFNAPFYGSAGDMKLARPIVSMVSAPDGCGYWFVASDGGIFAFNVAFHGSMGGQPLSAPVVGMAGDSATDGYWLAGSDGAVYSFGAPFLGAD